MPFIGLTPFLHTAIIDAGIPTMCQCPLSDSLHFYRSFLFQVLISSMCQCPLSGSLHFYFALTKEYNMDWKMCQCPLSGSLHFYPALWEAPVYKDSDYAFSPRFLKMLQKCYILLFFWFFLTFIFSNKVYLIINLLRLYHIFL